jgi:hypothetical protein
MPDGTQLWQTTMPPLNNTSVPDAFGGLIVTEYQTCTAGQTNAMTVVDLDGATGQPLWQAVGTGVSNGNGISYCYPAGTAPEIAVQADGSAIIVEPTNVGFSPLTQVHPNGATTTSSFPGTTVTNNGNTINVQCCVGPPMVNTDGNRYLEYEVRNILNNVITSDALYLYHSDNVFSPILLSSTTQDEALLPGPIISDGQGGVLATWTISPSHSVLPYPYQAADVVNGVEGTPYSLPFSPQTVTFEQSPTAVLGESGTAFASGPTSVTNNGTTTYVDQIASFNLSSGATNWTYQAATGNHLSIIEATYGNGLAAKSTDSSGNDTVLIFNSSGGLAPTRQNSSRSSRILKSYPALSGFSNIDYYSNGWWLGTSGGAGKCNSVRHEFVRSSSRNHSKQSTALPIIENFEPFDPGTNLLAANFMQRYEATNNTKGVSLFQLTSPVSRLGQWATWAAFQKQIFRQIPAVAFIGHSIVPTTAPGYPNRAAAICLYDQCAERATVPGDPEYCTIAGCFEGYSLNPPLPTFTVYPAPPLVSQATILFISTCNMDANMQTWLGISNSTAGRALVVPLSNAEIDMDMGEYEWLQILGFLTSGQNLQQAVSNANAAVVAKAPGTTITTTLSRHRHGK